MKIESSSPWPRLAKMALAVVAAAGAMSAHAALSYVATSPDFVATGQPPASQVVGSFSFTPSVLSLISSSTITNFTISGVWGGGAYQTATDDFMTAPSDLFVNGIEVASCSAFAECSSGYSMIYEGAETWSYTFSSSQYAGLLSALAKGPLTLTSVLDSPYSSNYPNALSSLQLSVTTTPVVAVPEPGSYALMLLGLGVVGTAVKRRARRTDAAA